MLQGLWDLRLNHTGAVLVNKLDSWDFRYFSVLIIICLICSVKHEYEGQWSEKTRLTTCDPHTKRLVVSSATPQEVENKKEIIFTYDVDFQASSCSNNQFTT